MIEKWVKELGFKNLKEWHKLIADIDITTPEKAQLFLNWRNDDGTKTGLLKLIKEIDK